jgi:DNA repair exonuclease SbcCD ATPase subunit
MKKLIPWIGYSGSTLQNSYNEDLEHGYLVWDIDVNTRKHDVEFVKLPNPRPFVTIDWQGSVDLTFDAAKDWPQQSRFRVRSQYALPASDAALLSSKLRKDKQATEIIFKSNDDESAKKFASASLGVDVRSLDAVESMLHEYYSNEEFDDATYDEMREVLCSAHSRVMLEDDTARNTVWTIRRLDFDNLYSYGSDNSIDFENKSGIVGIFGPNAIGKSSIVGSIMYTLFNTSDRDTNKNAHIVNSRKKSGCGRAVIVAAGSEYEIERKSEKVVSRGLLTANTSLTFKQLDGECEDLTGDLRPDTEKNIRKLIGNYEDFVVTCGSVQDDVARFLKEGPTQRKAILSRFLGIDVFEKLYVVLNSELSETKSKLKNLQTRDVLLASVKQIEESIAAAHLRVEILEKQKITCDVSRSDAYVVMQNLAKEVEIRKKVVEKNHFIEASLKKVQSCEEMIAKTKERIAQCSEHVARVEAKLTTLLTWDEMDVQRTRINEAKLGVQALKTEADKCGSAVTTAKRVSLKLIDVPCGDQYPMCVYIKDAHEMKRQLVSLEAHHIEALTKYTESVEKLAIFDEYKLNAARDLRKEQEAELARVNKSLNEAKTTLTKLYLEQEQARVDAAKYTSINLDNSDIESHYFEANTLYRTLSHELASYEADLKAVSNSIGKLEANLTKTQEDLVQRVTLERQMRIRELLVNAFSRRGIPNVVLSRLLPVVNNEMSKILDGVTNFNVNLVAEDATNALEIYIDDEGITKKSLRPLELGSGMERMMASLALRVALSNLTTLPKTDFMIIDEGFGSLDPTNAVACVSLLRKLKQYFRFILVISHIDIIKDAVDYAIEITNVNGDACVTSS